VKISCGGSPLKDGYLRLDPSIILWFAVKVAASLGRVFGELRLPLSGLYCLVNGSK
jgi:hypothetical protein